MDIVTRNKSIIIYKLTKGQLKMLADIIANVGYACFASIVLPFVVGVDTIPIPVLLLGGISSIGSWLLSLFLSR